MIYTSEKEKNICLTEGRNEEQKANQINRKSLRDYLYQYMLLVFAVYNYNANAETDIDQMHLMFRKNDIWPETWKKLSK